MSRNFAVLGKGGSPISFGPRQETSPPATFPGQYSELIEKLFHRPAAVSLVGANQVGANGDSSSDSVSSIAETLAFELAAQGKRVVIVPVANLLRLNPIPVPDDSSFMPGHTQHVWLWPTSAGQRIEFFKSVEPSVSGNWLDALRRNFHAVLLDCPHTQQDHGVAEIAAMSDATVLAVEAGITTKIQIQQNQRALQLRGVAVTGCILFHRK